MSAVMVDDPAVERYRYYRAVGARVRHLRTAAGYTQEAMARELGVEKTRICRWETASTHINVQQLHRFCTVVGCSADDVLNWLEFELDERTKAGSRK